MKKIGDIIGAFSKLNKREKRIIMIILSLIIIVISAVIYSFGLFFANKKVEEVKISYSTGERPEEDIVMKTKGKTEPKRMKVYSGDILRKIEKKEYAEIYKRLYPEYKEKYFPNLKDLEDYFEKQWPKNASIKEHAWQRIGDYDVLELGIYNTNNKEDENNKDKMYFVFKEYGFNDYHFSFSKR